MVYDEHNAPDPKKIEKELGEFLNKKFGGTVKIVSPPPAPQTQHSGEKKSGSENQKDLINFDIKPLELIRYLDQFVVKQDRAKSVLSTKVCTHFNRIKHARMNDENASRITGNIKSNILLLGPTGIGKTYIIKLIAKKIGVPFVKADATKFSETGYVGGDVEDLVRDLVKEADDNIELAECGIIYIDEIDKIASAGNVIGAQVSRTGVQRALLKPMEETDVDLKVPHDPVSMMQELERYQRTGQRHQRTVNTANILFIVSGAFNNLDDIIKERLDSKAIGFSAAHHHLKTEKNLLNRVTAEDLVTYGFESEFIGRLPVRCVLEHLTEQDLFDILLMPNNPVILGKRLDFAAYGISLVFTREALKRLAKSAYNENTGARGLVSVVENALMPFEETLPSSHITVLTVTPDVIDNSRDELEKMLLPKNRDYYISLFNEAKQRWEEDITGYITDNWKNLSLRHGLTLSHYRSRLVAKYFTTKVTETGDAVERVKSYHEKVKQMEMEIMNSCDFNIVFEEDAVDFIIEQFIDYNVSSDDILTQIYDRFYDGLNLIREKSGKNRFFLSRKALEHHEEFLNDLIRDELK